MGRTKKNVIKNSNYPFHTCYPLLKYVLFNTDEIYSSTADKIYVYYNRKLFCVRCTSVVYIACVTIRIPFAVYYSGGQDTRGPGTANIYCIHAWRMIGTWPRGGINNNSHPAAKRPEIGLYVARPQPKSNEIRRWRQKLRPGYRYKTCLRYGLAAE